MYRYRSYYRYRRLPRCEDCGCRNCVCGLECQCGNANWDGDDNGVTCNDCNTGPYEERRKHISEHVARKEHHCRMSRQLIRPGDKYRKVVQFGYYPGGAFTLTVRKVRLEKGPNWDIAEMMES